MICICKFLSRLLLCSICIFSITTGAYAATNLPTGDIGEYGDWLINNNEEYTQQISTDVNSYQQTFTEKVKTNTFVPIEAKISFVFMNALSLIDTILQNSLVRFTIIFLIIMYAFWIMIETYQMWHTANDYKTLIKELLKKGVLISVWVLVLQLGPAKIFMSIMGPIISVGSYLSDMILKSVADIYSTDLPDTCAAIHNYAHTYSGGNMLINADSAADIICVPTRLSGFFYTAIAAAWQWIQNGIGHSAFTVFAGCLFLILFIKNIFKFAFITLGIVSDLFLTLLMLPFTALAETLSATKYDGVVGKIFNGFLQVFNTKKLSEQIMVFINAAIYFVSLSIIIAICTALLNGVISINLIDSIPTLDNAGFITTLLGGFLVLYMIDKADKMAEELGGKIDNSIGKQLQSDAKILLNKSWNNIKTVTKIIITKKK